MVNTKKLFRIKIEHECFIVANDEAEALENFWEMRNDVNTNLDNFIDDITSVDEIDEAEELLEEEED